MAFGIWDYAVFVIVLTISVGIGIFHGCGAKQKTTNEFLMGNRQMQILPVSFSMTASFISAITVLGLPAEIYLYGTQFMLVSIAYGMLMPVLAFLYIPIYYNLKLTSMYEYLELRFRKPGLNMIGSITFIVQMTCYMSIVVYAPCLALNAVTGINLWLAMFTVGIVCTFYTALGGLKAVMWTDVFQIIIMVGGVLTILIKGSYDMGGFSNIWRIAQEGDRIEYFNFDPDPRTRNTVWSVIIGGFFQWLAIYGGSQAQMQRVLACPTLRNAQIALIINGPGLILLDIMCGLCGLICYAYYRKCDPIDNGDIKASDQILPYFVMENINIPGIPGLFVASVLSAALSSISSGLNSLSAVTMQDFVQKFIAPEMKEKTATICAKLLVLGYGVLMMALAVLASRVDAVMEAALSLFGMTGGPLLGLLCLGIYFPCANWKGGVTGWVVSLLCQCWFVFGSAIVQPFYPQLKRSTEGCDVSNVTQYNLTAESFYHSTTHSLYQNETTDHYASQDERQWFDEMFSITYLWYPFIGIMTTIVVGLLMSFITGGEDIENIDPLTIMPIWDKICCCLPESVRKQFSCNIGDIGKNGQQGMVKTDTAIKVDQPLMMTDRKQTLI